ncbi:MAG: DUF2088 domain-containing protein [Deltaproteobacteria bacterium]|nr:DUF2088 domain-containing protein [Deltaproteobacteria bacterium]
MNTPAEALASLTPPPHRLALVALPDLTRPIDAVSALAALERWLPPRSARIAVVGLGLHRPLSAAELAPLRAVWSGQVLNHDPDRCVRVGTVQGHPLEVNPLVLEADLRISVGVVELHQYAGFSGGHKGVVVGLGGRATLDALHHRDVVLHPEVIVGQLHPNPFRAAIDAMGERLGVALALLFNGARWFAGPPSPTLRQAAAGLRSWYQVSARAREVILRVPTTKAVNLYQASRAATYLALSPAPPLEDGATLFLDAACPEGMGQGSGERAFAEAMAAHAGNLDALLVGEAPRGAGTQRALMLARLARRYRLVITGCDTAATLRPYGLDATSVPAASLAGPRAITVPDAFHLLPQLAGATVEPSLS